MEICVVCIFTHKIIPTVNDDIKWRGSYIKPTYNRNQIFLFFNQGMVGTYRSGTIVEILYLTPLITNIYLATSTDSIPFTLTKDIHEFLSLNEKNNLVENSMLEGQLLLPGTIASFRQKYSFHRHKLLASTAI